MEATDGAFKGSDLCRPLRKQQEATSASASEDNRVAASFLEVEPTFQGLA